VLDFIKKHKLAFFLTLGTIAVVYAIFKTYEQEQAANAANQANAAQIAASQLAAQYAPYLYGDTSTAVGSGSDTTPSTLTSLGNYTNQTGTSQPSTTTQGSTVTSTPVTSTPSSPAGTSVTAAGAISPSVVSSAAPTGLAQAGTTTPTLGSPATTADEFLSNGSGPCQYQLSGVALQPGIPVCGPGGYIPPTLNPCDPGYEATSSGAYGQAGTGDAAVPVEPASCESEDSTTPAGGQVSTPSTTTSGITSIPSQTTPIVSGTGGQGSRVAKTVLSQYQSQNTSAGSAGSTGSSPASSLPTINGSLPAAGPNGLPILRKVAITNTGSTSNPTAVGPAPIINPVTSLTGSSSGSSTRKNPFTGQAITGRG
jgi:hypothetical protein